MDENNPVVILDGETWHIAENGRSSKIAHCGKSMNNQRTHSRISTVGVEHVCPNCVQLYQEDFPNALRKA
jgi:hypothetical protein